MKRIKADEMDSKKSANYFTSSSNVNSPVDDTKATTLGNDLIVRMCAMRRVN